ncbi:hypothetical protein [Gaetbulibacter jejuensis]|uniref:Capsular polysaccharide biosynthesis protein n=1 Tax=Gaetbulibacter jejuensis TaxID=584607 RepID=A0ABP3UTI9_9FLAO
MKVLFIPCAKKIPSDMEIRFGDIPSIMVPINKEPVLKKIHASANEVFDLILILTYDNSQFISDYVSQMKFDNVQILNIDKLKDIGYTISYGLNYLESLYGLNTVENLTINFGDTLVEDYDFFTNENLIAYADVIDFERWTTFEFDDGRILEILDKSENDVGKEFYHTFIGLFSISDVLKFNSLLKHSIKDSKTGVSADSFYNTIKQYNESYTFNFFHSGMWIDLGHSDNYMFKTSDETRFFNSIEIDKKRGIIKKSSSNWLKLTQEIEWYLNIPKDLKYLSPQILDYELNTLKTNVSLEYYNYPTLQEIYVFGNYSIDKWKLIFESIFFIQEEFSRYAKAFSEDDIKSAITKMYVDKTLNRIEEYKTKKHLKLFFESDTITINGKAYQSLKYFVENLSELTKAMGLYETTYFNPIHGDFCFSNLLYDPLTNIIRVIDPRGSFGDFKIYGDSRYEYAKMFHCINGGYDLIIKDLFDLKIVNGEIEYQIKKTEKHSVIRDLFIHKIKDKVESVEQIIFIEAVLFISMIPLHNDKPNRQVAMLCTALKLMDSIFSFEKLTNNFTLNQLTYD